MIQDNVNGWLFENGNADDLKNKLQSLIDDPRQVETCSKQVKAPTSMKEVGMSVEQTLLSKTRGIKK